LKSKTAEAVFQNCVKTVSALLALTRASSSSFHRDGNPKAIARISKGRPMRKVVIAKALVLIGFGLYLAAGLSRAPQVEAAAGHSIATAGQKRTH
jgi:hypothetical protein